MGKGASRRAGVWAGEKSGIINSRLVGDDSWRLQPADTVQPECAWVLVKDAERICRQDPPRAHKELSFQLPRSPSGRSGKRPEGFGGLGLCNHALQEARCSSYIHPVEDRSCICVRLHESEQHEKIGGVYRPTRKYPVGGPFECCELRQHVG